MTMTKVYVTTSLANHGNVSQLLTHELRTHGIEVGYIEDTDNIWCRDWMPIKCGDHYVKFEPKFNEFKWPHLHVPVDCWKFMPGVQRSKIVLDGGNVVRSPDGGTVILTDAVFDDNSQTSTIDLIQQLRVTLEADLVFLPVEPCDTLGHSDGIVAWIDETHVFVNDYQDEYGENVTRILSNAGIEAVPFPWLYEESHLDEHEFRMQFPLADDFNPAWGYAINFLHVDDLIVYPTFDSDGDVETMDTLAHWFPGHSLAPMDCKYISMLGGLCHCNTREP